MILLTKTFNIFLSIPIYLYSLKKSYISLFSFTEQCLISMEVIISWNIHHNTIIFYKSFRSIVMLAVTIVLLLLYILRQLKYSWFYNQSIATCLKKGINSSTVTQSTCSQVLSIYFTKKSFHFQVQIVIA